MGLRARNIVNKGGPRRGHQLTHLILDKRVISGWLFYNENNSLVETFYRTQHFNVSPSSSHEVDHNTSPSIIRSDGRRNPESLSSVRSTPKL